MKKLTELDLTSANLADSYKNKWQGMGKFYILNKFYKMIKYILWTNLSKHKGSIIWVTNLSMLDSLD